jgi:hypothetical protein
VRSYSLVGIAVIAVYSVVTGVAALRTGWMMPWARRRILRPRLWGYAHLLASVCCLVQLTVGVFLKGSDAEFTFSYPAGVLMSIGFPWLIWAARRPGRAR